MTFVLLVVIYIAFISLGLPDSILGSAWPSMYEGLHVSIASAGIISMIIAGGTIISSFFSDKVIHKLGTGKVMVISVAMTAVALLGFSRSTAFWMLCLWGIPYGLGAGSVDAALNNFVALHYESKHMSWLHCFWGIGATAGPYIMGICLTRGFGWQAGYQVIGLMQIVLVTGLFASLPLWKRKQAEKENASEEIRLYSKKEIIHIPGTKAVFLAFFCYCALEATAGLWASSYMVVYRGIAKERAAEWAALFYLGISVGRLLCGFITEQLGDCKMIHIGQVIIVIGIAILLLPFGNYMILLGLVLLGLGCAPIYPSLIHETPINFGADKSQAIIGMQMASAYIGTTFMAPLFGVMVEWVGIWLYPFYLLLFAVIMMIMNERLHKVTNDKKY